jgi:hypothetical protein
MSKWHCRARGIDQIHKERSFHEYQQESQYNTIIDQQITKQSPRAWERPKSHCGTEARMDSERGWDRSMSIIEPTRNNNGSPNRRTAAPLLESDANLIVEPKPEKILKRGGDRSIPTVGGKLSNIELLCVPLQWLLSSIGFCPMVLQLGL